MKLRAAAIPFSGLVCLRLLFAADFPGAEWPRASPAEVGLDERLLFEARDYALTGGGAGCVIREGRMVCSWGDLSQRFDLKSTTKSFGAAALGLAIRDGKVQLHAKAGLYHPTFGVPPDANEQTGWLKEISLFHLASQSAGFDKPGGYVSLLFKPGTEWSYSDSGPNWMAECLTLVFRRDLNTVMFEKLFTPLGITAADLVWRKNQYRPEEIDGIKRREFGAGISANVNAMARFGYLWLRGGEWEGDQLLPRDFVEIARTSSRDVVGLPVRKRDDYGAASSHYGLLWWNNADETIEGVPIDTFWSWGLFDSVIVVMPAFDIVVARAGQSWKRTQVADHYDVLKPFLLPIAKAARSGASPPAGKNHLETPYPPSPVIASIEWVPRSEIIRLAPGSAKWDVGPGESCSLPTKWMSADGRTVHLVFSGDDSFSVRKARIILRTK